MRRVLPLIAALVIALALTNPATAGASDSTDDVHDIVFPVIGDVHYTDTFGDPRPGGRTHEGQDLLGTKMQELVAADDGVVTTLTWPEASYGYYLRITADDGWVYTYVHINNDTPGTDDDAASRDDIYAPGIDKGARVSRGQLVAFMGDSGNAEHTDPHLHFEIHRPDGSLVNPMRSLDAAEHLDQPTGADEADAPPSPIARLAGEDRVATAVAVSGRGWADGAAVPVVLAAGDSYAEALPASVLAASKGGPLLLTTGSGLPDVVGTELERLGTTAVTVIGSVPTAVDDALRAAGITVTRVGVAGDPVGTAVAIATAMGGAAGVAVLVNEDRFADGVSASALAAGRGWPILLSTESVIPQATVDAWRAIGVTKLVLVGGTGVLGANIETFVHDHGRCAPAESCEVERIAGADRYATSVAVAERSLADRSDASVLLGTGTSFPDSLASGPLAARLDGIALLVDGSGRGDDGASRSFLTQHAHEVTDVAILGGRGAVTSTADRAIQEALGLA
jgi:putative cell wall-binding protein